MVGSENNKLFPPGTPAEEIYNWINYNSGTVTTAAMVRDYLPKLEPSRAILFREHLGELFEADFLNIVSRARLSPHSEGVDTFVVMRSQLRILREAHIVVWKHDMWDASYNGHEVFRGQPMDATLLNPGNQVWIPDVDLLVTDKEKLMRLTCGREEIDALTMAAMNVSYFPSSNLIGLAAYHVYPHDTPERVERVRTNATYRGVFMAFDSFRVGEPCTDDFGTSLLAMLNFLNLKVVRNEPWLPPRPERRRAQKEGRKLPTVSVVHLRRTMEGEVVEHEKGETGEKTVNWSCQWIVGGHWRNQYYPSLKANKQIYVAPYLKGPADKPFRSKNSVFAVVR